MESQVLHEQEQKKKPSPIDTTQKHLIINILIIVFIIVLIFMLSFDTPLKYQSLIVVVFLMNLYNISFIMNTYCKNKTKENKAKQEQLENARVGTRTRKKI